MLRTAGATLATVTATGCSGTPWTADRTPSVTPVPVPRSATPSPRTGVTVELVDFAFEPGTDKPLVVPAGTTVRFVWVTASHNLHVDSRPPASAWQGHPPIEEAGFVHQHPFDVAGRYEFWCEPHKSLGMVGTVVVE